MESEALVGKEHLMVSDGLRGVEDYMELTKIIGKTK